MSQCPYCHVDDGEGHRATCSYNNHRTEQERKRQEQIDGMTEKELLRAIYRLLVRS